MNGFLYGIGLHWRLNLRSKEILIHYYVVPLIFYLLVGSIFNTIMPDSADSLIQTMAVFGITLGGVLGSPYPLVEYYGTEIKKAYQVAGIPLWTMAFGNFISGLLHLFLMSMIIFFTSFAVFDAKRPENLAGYFLFLILLIMASLSVGMVFGLFIKSPSKMGMACQLVFLPSVLISGIMFPADMLPSALHNLGKVLPAYWGFKGMCADTIKAGDAAALVVIFAVSVILCAWKIKRIYVE